MIFSRNHFQPLGCQRIRAVFVSAGFNVRLDEGEEVGPVNQTGGVFLSGIAKARAPDAVRGEEFVDFGT